MLNSSPCFSVALTRLLLLNVYVSSLKKKDKEGEEERDGEAKTTTLAMF